MLGTQTAQGSDSFNRGPHPHWLGSKAGCPMVLCKRVASPLTPPSRAGFHGHVSISVSTACVSPGSSLAAPSLARSRSRNFILGTNKSTKKDWRVARTPNCLSLGAVWTESKHYGLAMQLSSTTLLEFGSPSHHTLTNVGGLSTHRVWRECLICTQALKPRRTLVKRDLYTGQNKENLNHILSRYTKDK